MPETHDEQAFLRAFDAYADALFRHACMRLSDRDRARDLVQESFLRTWDHVSQGKPVHEYRSFLYRVLNNLLIDEYRKKRSTSLDALLEDETVAPYIEAQLSEGSVAATQEALETQRYAKALPGVLSRLPETYRSVLTMRFLDGLSVKEIARVLDVSENVIAVRIHRGIAKLKQYYA